MSLDQYEQDEQDRIMELTNQFINEIRQLGVSSAQVFVSKVTVDGMRTMTYNEGIGDSMARKAMCADYVALDNLHTMRNIMDSI